MARALAAATLLCCTMVLVVAHTDNEDVLSGVGVEPAETRGADSARTAERGAEPPDDDDGDSAPFTLVVEHADGRRCSASLVSLRTAVTSARCARPSSPTVPPADLWIHAPPAAAAAPHSSRRVARIAFAAESETAEEEFPWSDADVAVLELESPLGGEARAILMATSGAECGPPGACHVVRARTRARTHRTHRTHTWLRIVDETLVPPDACSALVPRHSAAARGLLCLRGDTLCPSDRGAGVVCEGKLCGVVSRSVWQEQGQGQGQGRERRGGACGGLHAAAALSRWRRFLHCAHTPRACLRGGECAHLCTERRLLDDGSPPAPPAAAPPPPPAPLADTHHYAETTVEHQPTKPHRTSDVTENLERVSSSIKAGVAAVSAVSTSPRRPPPTRTPSPSLASSAAPSSQSAAAEFEPNRADFKAGEYGDNAAEYGGEEPATHSSSSSPSVSVPVRSSLAPPAPHHELSARVQQDDTAVKSARHLNTPTPLLLLLLYCITI